MSRMIAHSAFHDVEVGFERDVPITPFISENFEQYVKRHADLAEREQLVAMQEKTMMMREKIVLKREQKITRDESTIEINPKLLEELRIANERIANLRETNRRMRIENEENFNALLEENEKLDNQNSKHNANNARMESKVSEIVRECGVKCIEEIPVMIKELRKKLRELERQVHFARNHGTKESKTVTRDTLLARVPTPPDTPISTLDSTLTPPTSSLTKTTSKPLAPRAIPASIAATAIASPTGTSSASDRGSIAHAHRVVFVRDRDVRFGPLSPNSKTSERGGNESMIGGRTGSSGSGDDGIVRSDGPKRKREGDQIRPGKKTSTKPREHWSLESRYSHCSQDQTNPNRITIPLTDPTPTPTPTPIPKPPKPLKRPGWYYVEDSPSPAEPVVLKAWLRSGRD